MLIVAADVPVMSDGEEEMDERVGKEGDPISLEVSSVKRKKQQRSDEEKKRSREDRGE